MMRSTRQPNQTGESGSIVTPAAAVLLPLARAFLLADAALDAAAARLRGAAGLGADLGADDQVTQLGQAPGAVAALAFKATHEAGE